MSIERLKTATILANKILIKEVTQLEYYNGVNLHKNAPTLKRVITNNILPGNQLLIYSSFSNQLIFDETKINIENISDELLEILILHEYVHMISANLEKNQIGFQSESLPITYNEALTQWLTLRLYYGLDNLDEAIEKNIIYPQSVKALNEIIKQVGEENIFNHFFEADLKANIKEFPQDKKSKWVDFILQLSQSEEENISKSDIFQLEETITKKN